MMDMSHKQDFFESKAILVTGASGFLAKVFVEKILRVLPNIKKLYLLMRAPDNISASRRLQTELLETDLFTPVKEKMGENFTTFISNKLTAVAGDVSVEDLGLKDYGIRREICSEVDVIVNSAATTNFIERYEKALGANTLGVKHVLNFCKSCVKLKLLLHVSTAYVCGETRGLVPEKLLNARPGLDIDAENKVANDKLNQLEEQGASKEMIKSAMQDLGSERSKFHGWPNTYVFTKAMGEMLLRRMKGNLSICVVRPTIITSTYKEPFPGWIEGIRTLDIASIAYAKGKLPCFMGDDDVILDVIPADMVVNVMVAATVAQANHVGDIAVYQVGSSQTNPLRLVAFQDYNVKYFIKQPWINHHGKPVKVHKLKMFSSPDSFLRYITIRLVLPLKILKVVNAITCQHIQRLYLDLSRKVNIAQRLGEYYKPYVFFQGVFGVSNTEELRMAAARGSDLDADLFYFDPRSINWEDYFLRTHLPGIIKWARMKSSSK